MRILIIEGDKKTAEYICRGIEQAGHTCDATSDGSTGLFRALYNDFDLMIVDLGVCEIDGLSIVKTLRNANIETPALILTSIGGIDDHINGLEAGGDDCLAKPFAMSELLARIDALTRREQAQSQRTILRVADLEIDVIHKLATRQGLALELQPLEFLLLETLARADGRVVTRTMLLEQVWNFHFTPKTNIVETLVCRLRSKLDKPFGTSLIHTIRNEGYSLHAQC